MSVSGSSLLTHQEPDGQFSMILLFSSVVMAMAKGVLLIVVGVVMVAQCRFNFILYYSYIQTSRQRKIQQQ